MERALEFAVLIPIVGEGDGAEILLLKRASRAGDPYAGQVCLPGGRREPSDHSLLDCALRETEEELGVPRGLVEVFAEIDWHETRLGHRVKPFAGRLDARARLTPNPQEVERVLRLPLVHVRPELFRCRGTWTGAGGSVHTVHAFELDGEEVWGLTARILLDYFTARPAPRSGHQAPR